MKWQEALLCLTVAANPLLLLLAHGRGGESSRRQWAYRSCWMTQTSLHYPLYLFRTYHCPLLYPHHRNPCRDPHHRVTRTICRVGPLHPQVFLFLDLQLFYLFHPLRFPCVIRHQRTDVVEHPQILSPLSRTHWTRDGALTATGDSPVRLGTCSITQRLDFGPRRHDWHAYGCRALLFLFCEILGCTSWWDGRGCWPKEAVRAY